MEKTRDQYYSFTTTGKVITRYLKSNPDNILQLYLTRKENKSIKHI